MHESARCRNALLNLAVSRDPTESAVDDDDDSDGWVAERNDEAPAPLPQQQRVEHPAASAPVGNEDDAGEVCL